MAPLSACKSESKFFIRAKDRDFVPSLQNYCKEAIEQLDNTNRIQENKKVNNELWSWRALRLLSR